VRYGVVVGVLCGLLAGTAVPLGDAGQDADADTVTVAPVPASTTEPVKYYVVGKPKNGQREYLFDIAAKTLGDGNRYREIFELNKGRLQPDGRRMEDPTVVEPGWILLLPPDASGPGVRHGPLPQVTAQPVHRGSRTDAARSDGNGVASVLGIAVLAAVALIMVGALLLRRRGEHPDAGSTAPGPDAGSAAAEPEPPVPPDSVLDAEVADGGDTIVVRLAGTQTRTRRPYTWVAAGDPHPQTAGTVALGVRDDSTLVVDLLLSPDVLTLTGPATHRARLVHSLAGQLHRNGAAVVVVGDAAGERTPEGAAAVPSYDHVAGHTGQSPLLVIFGSDTDTQGIPVIRRLVRRSHARTVLVIVGDARRARWSFHVEPARTGSAEAKA
jgi:hypothetical protein